MPTDNRCQFCNGLYSLAAECLVVTLTFVHVIMSAVEILIHLDVIHVPNSARQLSTSTELTGSNNATSTTSQPHDPGGCHIALHQDLEVAIQILRYATLVISALFVIEIVSKVIFLKKRFFKDGWQIFDCMVVFLSIGVEIAFYLIHEELYCYHAATEAATFIILLRLWRIPRTCNVRKKELRRTYDNEIRYNTQTKVEQEKAQQRLEKRVEYLETVLRNNSMLDTTDSGAVEHRGSPVKNGILAAAQRVLHTEPVNNTEHTNNVSNNSNVRSDSDINKQTAVVDDRRGTDLERNDSDKNSGGNDSGIEVKDSFKSERNTIQTYHRNTPAEDDVFESDGSEINARIEEVEVQIEEPSRQKQLPSITSYRRSVEEEDDDVVLLRRKQSSSSAAYCVNAGFETPESDITHESITYRSAEGVPMTEL